MNRKTSQNCLAAALNSYYDYYHIVGNEDHGLAWNFILGLVDRHMSVTLKEKEKHTTPRKQDGAGYFQRNAVQLVKGGKDYFNRLESLIDQAQQSIFLQTYIFEADETGQRIAGALIRAAGRNVKVAVLLDGYASQHLPAWLTESLRNAGVRLDWFQPLLKSKKFYFGRRLHHKVVVVDSSKALVGGINISDRYNDTDTHRAWLDWAVHVEGDAAPLIQRICQRRSKILWSGKKNAVSIPQPDPGHAASSKVRVRINDWVNRKMQVWNSYMEMFRKAKSHIVIMSPYFMPGYAFRKKISEAAKRGVDVSVILGSKSDVTIARYAEQYLYPWLLRNNITIYEYQQNVLHGKLATYDNKWVTVGSYNINNISAYASVELNVDVADAEFASGVQSELRRIMRDDCVKITLSHYEKRASLFHRFLQRSAYDIIRILFFVFTFYFRQRD